MDNRCLPSAAPGRDAHPGLAPYAALKAELLSLPHEQRLARCTALAGRRGLVSAAGVPLRFVDAGGPADALGYEEAILQHGRIAWRSDRKGGLHDLHNALVWLTFPRIKAMLNRLHLTGREEGCGVADPAGAAAVGGQGGHGSRGRRRDLLTLLDESGLVWLSASPRLDEDLRAKRWHSLLVAGREEIRALVRPIVIGHGLLEKLTVPYKSMTAHCLTMPWEQSMPTEIDAPAVDRAVAGHLGRAFASTPLPVLAPLPILGLPDWDSANLDASYYDDVRVFRTP